MTWLRGRATDPRLDLGPSGPFESRFAGLIDRSFQSDDEAVENVRSRVLDAFVQHASATTPSRFGRPATARPGFGRPARRGLAGVLAVSASLVAFGAVAIAAEPGAPLYQVRLQVESATLPSVDAPAGWQARLDRLQRRIGEGVAGGVRSDSAALDAALGEYRVELTALVALSADPVRRAALLTAVARDLPVVADLDHRHPSATADLALGAIRAAFATIDRDSGADEVRPGDPHADGATGNPHADGTTGDPHADGVTGDPHADGTTGDPHADGTTGDPHAGGATGNPHADGTTGNPHPGGTTGNPHGDGTTGNPHPGGSGQSKGKPPVKPGKPSN